MRHAGLIRTVSIVAFVTVPLYLIARVVIMAG